MTPPVNPVAQAVAGTATAKLWAPGIAVVVALLFFVGFYVYPADSSGILYLITVVPLFLLISFLVLIYILNDRVRRRRRHPTLLITVVAFWAASMPLFLYEHRHPFEIRGIVRWLTESRELKNEVLTSGQRKDGELKSMDWDGWGAFAQDTEVYLVFDPADSLAAAAKAHRPGKFAGIPCEVQDVRRLEDHWYSVVFYTSQTWGHCGDSAP